MALLDDAIDACGGLARWNSLSRFTLHLSVGGSLFSDAGHAREFKDVTAEGSTRTQSVRFTGITGGEQCGAFGRDGDGHQAAYLTQLSGCHSAGCRADG